MKASFDGMRKIATHNMNNLYDVINTILLDKSYQNIDEDLKEDLIKKFNLSALSVDNFNCLFDPTVKDDMNNLSHLSISRLEEKE